MADGKEYPLTIKQERFCHAYIKTGNASEAYRQAYDTENSTDKTIWEAASHLLADSKVKARVNKLKADMLKHLQVTVESLTSEYETARACAERQDNPAGQVAAVTGKAKLHGLLIEKRQLEAHISTNAESMTDDQLAKVVGMDDSEEHVHSSTSKH